MARLEFPIAADGLICDALVGLRASLIAAIQAGGHTFPSPVRCRAQVDTGCNRTALSSAVLSALRLGIPLATRSTQTAAGSASVGLFRISLSVVDFSLPSSPMLTEPDLLVVELHPPIPGIDLLIGMDVLRSCRLIVDSPVGGFSLEW